MVSVRPARPDEVGALSVAIAARQRHPESHCCYLSDEPAAIAEEIDAVPDWTALSAVAEHDGEVVGCLIGELDPDLGRVWWFGPFVDPAMASWRVVADALYDQATARLPTAVTGEELAGDGRFTELAAWATNRGFAEEEASVCVATDRTIAPDPADPATHRASPGDSGRVAALHDELFPGTHYRGEQLVALDTDDRLLLVSGENSLVTGYVAAEIQADGSGYIDFVGVAPEARRQGLGSALIRASASALRDRGCQRLHLTVRDGNSAARAMYQALGFIEERRLVPLRRGFSIA